MEDRRWMEFVLASGQRLTSRQLNWNDLPLRDVEAVILHLKHDKVGVFKRDLPADLFQELVVFRSSGTTLQVIQRGPDIERHQIPFDSWTVGWTDGVREFLDEYDIKTSKHLRRYIHPRNFILSPTHFHRESPRIVRWSQ